MNSCLKDMKLDNSILPPVPNHYMEMNKQRVLSDLTRDFDGRDNNVILGLRNQSVRVLNQKGQWKTLAKQYVYFITQDRDGRGLWRGKFLRRSDKGELEWHDLIRYKNEKAWKPFERERWESPR